MRRNTPAPYRVAIIGCGRVGVLYEAEPLRRKPASHAGVAQANPKTELVALVDTNAKALLRAGKIFPKVGRYRSVRECLQKERPDIVVIATPPSVRLVPIQECLRAGVRAIVCEKPLAETARDARAIARMVSKDKGVFVVNYQRRFSPLMARVRRDIHSGALGTIQQVTCYYSNGLYNNGGHALDALQYLLGEDMHAVWARTNPKAMHPSGDSCVDAVLETKTGTRVVLQSIDQKAYGIFDIRILGSKGERALLDNSDALIETPARSSSYKGERALDRARATVRRGAPAHALDRAAQYLTNRERPESGVENGRAVVELLEEIKKHAQKKK